PLADRGGPAGHGGRELLDGADEPLHQPGAGDLATGGVDLRPVVALRPDQRGGLPIHPPPPARGRGRPVRPAPQRGGQRRHVDQQDHRATARAVPPGPCGGESRPAELTRAVLFQPGSSLLRAADGRSGPVAADDPPDAGQSPPAAGGVPGLLRRLLAVRRPEPWARAPRPPDEALRRREGGAHRWGVGETAWESTVVGTYRQRDIEVSHATGTGSGT